MKQPIEKTAAIVPSFSKTASITAAVVFLLAIALVILPQPSQGHQGATGVVKERMDMMDTIGDDMKAIKSMVTKKQPFDADKLAQHAESIRALSVRIGEVFPEGSLGMPSEALPAIWKNWEDFTRMADKLTLEATKLRDIAADGDLGPTMKQFAAVGKTCRSCHTDFRKKKER